jgi:hypothetical protein
MGWRLYMRIETTEGATARHRCSSFGRSVACGGLVADRNRCDFGTCFDSSVPRNSSRSNLFLMALHEAHGHDLSHSAGGVGGTATAGKPPTFVESVDAAASPVPDALCAGLETCARDAIP